MADYDELMTGQRREAQLTCLEELPAFCEKGDSLVWALLKGSNKFFFFDFWDGFCGVCLEVFVLF